MIVLLFVLPSLRLTNNLWIFEIRMFSLGEIVDRRYMPAYLYIFITAKIFGSLSWNFLNSVYEARSSNLFYFILLLLEWHMTMWQKLKNTLRDWLSVFGFSFQFQCMAYIRHTHATYTFLFYPLYCVPSQCFFLLVVAWEPIIVLKYWYL